MADNMKHTRFPFRFKAMLIGSIVLLSILGGWLCLPGCAAWCVRRGVAPDFSGRVLLWLGPRAGGHVFSLWEHCDPDVWSAHIMKLCSEAENDPAARKKFISSFSDLNARDELGQTILFQAIQWGGVDLIGSLLTEGADVNARDKEENTPLHHAMLGTTIDVVDVLLEGGADVNARDDAGRTVLDSFAFNNREQRLIDLLRHHGAKTGWQLDTDDMLSSEVIPPEFKMSVPMIAEINFGPKGHDSSEAAVPYSLDAGLVFDLERGYGWDHDVSALAVERADPEFSPIENTFINIGEATRTWQLVVDNALYKITLACGDTEDASGPHRVVIEGQVVINNVAVGKGEFAKATAVPVSVTDGRVTIEVGDTDAPTIINNLAVGKVVLRQETFEQ
ncbi:MAG: ankyrin repeat domain-containing protein [Armatimonadetes bacterium]|nr:ankyrin repeat domain-containing protein [Armatimonadota bacterium]